MILESTNPKFQTRPQIPAGRKFYEPRQVAVIDVDFVSAGSRSWARGESDREPFVDRKPHEAPVPIRNREPEPAHRPSSLTLFDESHDAPLWQIIDLYTGVVFARVRGSLPRVVSQMRLAAHQLGGKEQDLCYRRTN